MSNIEPTPFGDKYLLVEHIATGGMAEVYRAQYTGIEGFAKELVVKRLREEFVERPEIVEMFLDEARVAATLTHNNVVHTYDLGEIEGEFFIAMELLIGQELVAVLRRAGATGLMVPLDITLGIVMQGLEGLHYAHSRLDETGQPLGLVHRDINPTNIHVGYDGLCKIVDFGIAATRASAVSQRGGVAQFAGKLSYMAPEQIYGEPLDGRADIFAVGVILYEMCVGKRLFRGKPEDVKERILAGDIPAPTFVDPDFPPALEAIIMRALEIDAGDRYQNCDHMYRELETFMHQGGLVATPRKISAFMSEMFGEGAPAVVDYDDQYDDLGDNALDFDAFDTLDGSHDDEPDWVRQLDPGATTGTEKRRRMTIGNLEELVADIQRDGSIEDSGVRKREPGKASGHHPVVQEAPAAEADEPEPEDSSSRRRARARQAQGRSPAARPEARAAASQRGAVAAREPVPASRIASRSPSPRATMSTAAIETGVSGSFGQGVVTEQTKRGNPLVWLAAIVIIGALVYFGYTILTSK